MEAGELHRCLCGELVPEEVPQTLLRAASSAVTNVYVPPLHEHDETWFRSGSTEQLLVRLPAQTGHLSRVIGLCEDP